MKEIQDKIKKGAEEIEQFLNKHLDEIVEQYGKILEQSEGHPTIRFEDELPYPKGIILSALLRELRESEKDKDENYRNVVESCIALLSNFIPTEEKYRELLKQKKIEETMLKYKDKPEEAIKKLSEI
ncbi:hypothetical protein IIA15_10145 [candidate division TA06 bacterium]|nr:hypothetical protein [candidate division TA06 bacterium]